MIRVSDLERSVAFYGDPLSMVEMRREDYPEGQFTLSLLGYGNETQGVNGGVKTCHWGGAKVGHFGECALDR
jgi:catechol 2,3-dioxygenase-like lactoylglutathione lyase family enzyme